MKTKYIVLIIYYNIISPKPGSKDQGYFLTFIGHASPPQDEISASVPQQKKSIECQKKESSFKNNERWNQSGVEQLTKGTSRTLASWRARSEIISRWDVCRSLWARRTNSKGSLGLAATLGNGVVQLGLGILPGSGSYKNEICLLGSLIASSYRLVATIFWET